LTRFVGKISREILVCAWAIKHVKEETVIQANTGAVVFDQLCKICVASEVNIPKKACDGMTN